MPMYQVGDAANAFNVGLEGIVYLAFAVGFCFLIYASFFGFLLLRDLWRQYRARRDLTVMDSGAYVIEHCPFSFARCDLARRHELSSTCAEKDVS